MSISKILIICWSFVLSVTIFATYDLITFKLFVRLFGRMSRGSLWDFMLASTIHMFIVWVVGCSIILIGCWVVDRKTKDISPPKKPLTDKEWAKDFLKKHGVETLK